ncbi:MAG: glutamate racemase [Elusimicrobia bacterium]|nr:glutamate racemase [Elusimicrobiota bacterium]
MQNNRRPEQRLWRHRCRELCERPIGIFDSGMGGLTVFSAVRKILPGENIIYFGDTARVPYGTKSKKTVTSFSVEIAEHLVRKNIKLLVVACNTASSLALKEIRSRIRVPVIGVIEPGVETALKETKNKKILVIATNSTVSSHAYAQMLKKKSPETEVCEKACPLFVPLVEEGWCGRQATFMVANEYFAGLKKTGFDTIILGCTHYPLLKKVIGKIVGEKVNIIDSARSVAGHVFEALKKNGMFNPGSRGYSKFIVSDAPEKFSGLAWRLLKIRVRDIKIKRF